MLVLDEITKIFTNTQHQITALNSVTLEVYPGEVTAIYGNSGSGKSTLLLTAGGLLTPDKGTVVIDGENPYGMKTDERGVFRAKNIGFVFQQFYLIPYLNVLDNILAAALDDGRQTRDRANEHLEQFGLSGRISHYPEQLSVGEQQRTAMVRAMINQPKMILADEPTGNLDNRNSQIVLDQLMAFADTGGMVMIVTHDPRILKVAHRLVNLVKGRVSDLDALPDNHTEGWVAPTHISQAVPEQ